MMDQPAMISTGIIPANKAAATDEQPDLLEELMHVDEQEADKENAVNYLRDVVLNANSQEMIEEVKQNSIIV